MPKIFRSRCSTLVAAVFVALAFGLGCSPQIGDACENNNDCPDEGGVICDRSVQDGLCTVPGCRAGECPSESVCIEYDRHESYCMRSCESDEDCREGHICRDDEEFDDRYCFVDDAGS